MSDQEPEERQPGSPPSAGDSEPEDHAAAAAGDPPATAPDEPGGPAQDALAQDALTQDDPALPEPDQPDPDATTLLPRTAGGSRVTARDEDDLDDDDVDPRADRRRLITLTAVIAVVAILGLVVGYAIIRASGRPIASPVAGAGSADPGAAAGASEQPSTAPIGDDLTLSADQASTLDKKRVWKVALTQRGTSADSRNHPACLSVDSEGAPVAQQTVLRLLGSSGDRAPAALHQARAYASPEEAAQAYAQAARALGDCAMTGAWIYEGHAIEGVGDQAVGVTIEVLGGKRPEYRTVVLTRTGRIVDVIDVASPRKPVSAKRVARVAGAVVDTQCQISGGACSDEPEARDGPPPPGGDQPGFLASGDLPPMGAELTRWVGTTPGAPDPDLLRGSGCETVAWSKVDAESRSHRTYLLADSTSRFGLDQVIITAKSAKAAEKLAEKVRDGWQSCARRQLTASVADIERVGGPGARSVDVDGWTTRVSQKSDKETVDYRVGVVTAGPKAVFLFLNPQDKLDLTPEQFDTVTVRAGQRATQVS